MLRTIGCLLSIAGAAGLAWPADANLLAKEQCEQIKAEQTALGPKKLRDALEKGPAWAKANLTAGEYDVMRKFIELEEQLLFRCPLAKLPKSLAKHVAPAEDGDEEEKPANKSPAKKAPADKATAPAKKAPSADPKAAPKAAQAPAGPAPASKPKDAYVPPKAKANDAFVAPPKAPAP